MKYIYQCIKDCCVSLFNKFDKLAPINEWVKVSYLLLASTRNLKFLLQNANQRQFCFLFESLIEFVILKKNKQLLVILDALLVYHSSKYVCWISSPVRDQGIYNYDIVKKEETKHLSIFPVSTSSVLTTIQYNH